MGRHNSFKSNEDISSVLAAMFPDSEFAKSFTCGENKTAYLAKYGIASFMNKTTKSKQMDIHVRYWPTDDTDSHVLSRYYGSQFMLDHFNVSIPNSKLIKLCDGL